MLQLSIKVFSLCTTLLLVTLHCSSSQAGRHVMQAGGIHMGLTRTTLVADNAQFRSGLSGGLYVDIEAQQSWLPAHATIEVTFTQRTAYLKMPWPKVNRNNSSVPTQPPHAPISSCLYYSSSKSH